MRFLPNFHLDRLSFWIGFFAGALFWWAVTIFRHNWPRIRGYLFTKIQQLREKLTASTEVRLANDILRLAQNQHLAASLFSLDEILITPRIMAPPPRINPENEIQHSEILDTMIPYMPDWPEFAALYHGPTITLSEALQNGANLILIGQPGSGKTVALAHFASLIAKRDPQAGMFANYVPLFIHMADIPTTSLSSNAPLEVLVNAMSGRVSTLTLPRLPNLLSTAFDNKRVMLLLDGLDELPPVAIQQFVTFLGTLLKRYPGTRIVVAASPDYYDGLNSLGLIPVAVAAWDEQQRAAFIEKWRGLWAQFIAPITPFETEEIDPLLLNGWLSTWDLNLTPLELTLKVWAAYADDARGADSVNAIESYVRRMTQEHPDIRPALGRLAIQMVATLSPTFNQKEAENWLVEFETPPSTSQEEATSEQGEQIPKKQPASKPTISYRILPALVSSGLLIPRSGSRLSFIHPLINGYLAGAALSKDGNISSIQSQPEWISKSLTLNYLACFSDVTNLVITILGQTDDPLQRKQLAVARWLREAPKNQTWRITVMRYLANMMQKESLTLGLSGRALAAMVMSGDPGVSTLLRHLLKSEQSNLRQLAALGCGVIHDTKAVDDLSILSNDTIPSISRAACHALVTIGNKQAMDAIVATLLQGTENGRRAAAEALADNPEEGHPALIDGTKMDDLLVRRAVVYGLAQVNQPWSIEILEKVQIEDGQWIVRNAASEALENLRQPNPYIPYPLPQLSETPWLIAFAAKLGMGVIPGKPAMELLIQALKDGSEVQRLAALEYLRLKGGEDTVLHIYHALYGNLGALREMAYNTLWHIGSTGANLPPPIQFGLG